MKRSLRWLIWLLIVFSALTQGGDLLARGGRGGGGSRGGGGFSGGGGYRGGGGGYSRPSISHTPSMSRPAPRPSQSMASRPAARPSVGPPRVSQPIAGARPGVGTRPAPGTRPAMGARPGGGVATRPTGDQLQNFLDLPTAGAARPGTLPANRPSSFPAGGALVGGAAGGAAMEFLQGGGARPSTLPAGGQRPGAGPGQRPGEGQRPGAGQRPGLGDRPASGNRPERIENRNERHESRDTRRDEVRDQVRENNPRLDFWAENPNWAAWRINQPYRWAAWGAIAGWVGYGWTDEAAYSYGENVYYQDDTVYYGDQPVATAEEYAQQAEAIVESAPEVAPESEWLPLGVFALTPDGQASGPDPTLFLQLAINKQGVISGTLHNSATNTTQTIEGMADKNTQRCAWTVTGTSRPLMETGISNLTKDSAPALVHFADGQTQQWLMVHLEEPTAESATQPGQPTTQPAAQPATQPSIPPPATLPVQP